MRVPTKKPIKIGIIGTGFGKTIGLNFKAVDPLCQVYFAGRDIEKAKSISKEISGEGVFNNWQQLVSDPKIDLVVIASPSALHKEMFEFAAKNQKNILVEKPAAIYARDIDSMSKSETGKLAAVNHEGRFHPVVLSIKDLISSGRLGKILAVRIGAYLNWYSNPDYKESWGNFKESGGGQILSIGTHQIDLARFLLGMPKIASGLVQTTIYQDPKFKKKITAETQLSAQFLTVDHTSIQLFNDCYCFGYKDFIIEVMGSRGVVIYSDLRGLKSSFSNSSPLEDVAWVDPLSEIRLGNSILTRSMKYMAKALLESVSQGKSNPLFCSLEEARDNLEIFERFKS